MGHMGGKRVRRRAWDCRDAETPSEEATTDNELAAEQTDLGDIYGKNRVWRMGRMRVSECG